MAVYIPVECPTCKDKRFIVKFGQTTNRKQRFLCQNKNCDKNTFIINHQNKGCTPEVKEKIIDMKLKGSSIRAIARILGISTTTVISEIKKRKYA